MLVKLMYRRLEPDADRVLGEIPIPKMKRAAVEELLDGNVEKYSEQRVPAVPTFEMSVAAGEWADVTDVAEVMQPGQIDHGLFRIRISGDSMRTKYKSGDVVEFRCMREGRDVMEVGKDYYVQKSDGTATFKRLEAIEEEELILRALNKRKFPKPIVVARREIVRMALAVFKGEAV